jgi:hypothetical protein
MDSRLRVSSPLWAVEIPGIKRSKRQHLSSVFITKGSGFIYALEIKKGFLRGARIEFLFAAPES